MLLGPESHTSKTQRDSLQTILCFIPVDDAETSCSGCRNTELRAVRMQARNAGPKWGEEPGYAHLEPSAGCRVSPSSEPVLLQGGGHGAGPVKARGYPERWLMLFLYALNMATLSALASALPSSQLPAEKLYDVKSNVIWLQLRRAHLGWRTWPSSDASQSS
eukprot:2372642-Rhodomonas_salina.2